MQKKYQFLKSTKNGHVYHANPILLKRKDMVPCDKHGKTAMENAGYVNPVNGVQAMTAPGVMDAPPMPSQDDDHEQGPQAQTADENQSKEPDLLDEDAAKSKVVEWFGKDVSKVTKAELVEYAGKAMQLTLDEELTKLQMVSAMAKA